jgi:hypothetical protein
MNSHLPYDRFINFWYELSYDIRRALSFFIIDMPYDLKFIIDMSYVRNVKDRRRQPEGENRSQSKFLNGTYLYPKSNLTPLSSNMTRTT